jgi:multiple sugar transport system permease protein
MGHESRAAFWARTAIIALGGIVFLFPFVWMVSTSLTTTGELFKLPPSIIPDPIDTSAYDRLFSDVPILRWVFNSVLVSLSVTLLQVLSSAMAAYAFTRLDFKGRNVVFVLFLATLMVPFQVMVVPLFIELR